MNDCQNCLLGKLAPLGRAQIIMLDGGLNELLLFTCTHCHFVKFERPSVTTLELELKEHNAS